MNIQFRLNDDSTLTQQVCTRLRDAIVRLELAPGEGLSESDIARRFGVSRQPVREAFIKLAEMGLVAIRPQRGTVVRQISIAEVMNARFVREAVEVAVVREVASANPDTLSRRLATLLAAQDVAVADRDAVAFLRLDEAFHEAIAEGAGRAMAWRVLENLKAQMDRVRFLSFEGATPLSELLNQHRRIAAAISAGNPAQAEAAMRGHLREILASLPLIAAAHPDYFTRDDANPGEFTLEEPVSQETSKGGTGP